MTDLCVQILAAAAWIVGEYCEVLVSPDSPPVYPTLVSLLTHPGVYRQHPARVQSAYLQCLTKVLLRAAHAQGAQGAEGLETAAVLMALLRIRLPTCRALVSHTYCFVIYIYHLICMLV